MTYFERWKIVLITFVCLLGLVYALPNVLGQKALENVRSALPSWMPAKTISLGLDLQGGSHLLMQVEMDKVVSERLDSMEDTARKELRKEKIGYTGLKKSKEGLSFKITDLENDRAGAYKIASGLFEGLEIFIDDETSVLTASFGLPALVKLKGQIIGQSIEIVRRRIDGSGLREPIIQRQGTDRILIQLPGVENPDEIKKLIGPTAQMSFNLVDMSANSDMSGVHKAPAGRKILEFSDRPGTIVVNKRDIVTGDMLIDSRPTFDNGAPVVSFQFDKVGARKFCDVTRKNTGVLFAIILDDKVISAPRINDAICGGRGIITGSFSVAEANELSLLLRAGALPAPLTVIEERTVGPSLGADSVNAGKMASIIGMFFVLVFMAMSYRLFGIFANIALLINMVLLFACLSAFQATLTLPGIAGIVLTIGMAVDANVLIFERIREELAGGRSPRSAIDSGYRQAMSTIVDANVTTLIAALLLLSFGTGPIKGFAMTLWIGIATSMFSATVLTRLFVVMWLNKNKSRTDLPV